MNCENQMSYTIQPRDTLYNIAIRYNTSVEDIIARNPFLNPYNLIIGSTIIICPNSNRSNEDRFLGISLQALKLYTEMYVLWEQHVFWTRLLLVSITENLNDLEPTKKRLLRNPSDIANVYRRYYSERDAKTIENLLTEHLVIGADLIVALKNKDSALSTALSQKWYKNADEMAKAFASINPFYGEESLRQMLHTHLDLTSQEVDARLRKDYAAEINAFDMVEQEALRMARYLVSGIINNFPDLFR